MKNLIKIHADAGELTEELQALALEFAAKKSQLAPVFFDTLDGFSDGSAIEIKQGVTADAFNVLLVFKFSESFRNFVRAFRAGDFSVE